MSFAIAVLCIANVNAQEKGDWYIGAGDIANTAWTEWSIAPTVGYGITNNLMVGLNVSQADSSAEMELDVHARYYWNGLFGYVSATISLQQEDWDKAGEWMWKNRDCYNGLSVLPYDGGTYTQAPFEDIKKSEFNKLVKSLQDVNLENVMELTDETDLSGELACAGGSCEITGL